jgi:hypothetical protein
MNRRDFIKSTSTGALALATTPALLADAPAKGKHDFRYPYYVNCYIQNQKYWPLEEYKKGSFSGDKAGLDSEGYMGDKWVDGKLRFYGFGQAVGFIDMQSLVVPFEHEIAYEVFHERTNNPLVPPKHIFNYWVKLIRSTELLPPVVKETKWIHPEYIDYSEDGALIEYV